jgi:hypothetical protein
MAVAAAVTVSVAIGVAMPLEILRWILAGMLVSLGAPVSSGTAIRVGRG